MLQRTQRGDQSLGAPSVSHPSTSSTTLEGLARPRPILSLAPTLWLEAIIYPLSIYQFIHLQSREETEQHCSSGKNRQLESSSPQALLLLLQEPGASQDSDPPSQICC